MGYRLAESDELNCQTGLPLDGGTRRPPWLEYTIEAGDGGYCQFSCLANPNQHQGQVWIALPNPASLAKVDVLELPASKRKYAAIAEVASDKLGMVMAVKLFKHQDTVALLVGYDAGYTSLFSLLDDDTWTSVVRIGSQSHPILSISVSPSADAFFTSSASAYITKVHLPDCSLRKLELNADFQTLSKNTKHAGQTSLKARDDGRILVTAGWDGKLRVFSSLTLAPLAVLKWHTSAVHAAAFSSVRDDAPSFVVGGAKDGKLSMWQIY